MRYQYPELQEEMIQRQLDKMRKDAWLEMNDDLTAMEQVKVLNKIFFDIHGFSGNTIKLPCSTEFIYQHCS